jgi:hypothetical protein
MGQRHGGRARTWARCRAGYWKRQWTMVNSHVEPVAFSHGADGSVVVEVHQQVKDLEGKVLVDQMVGHIFRVEDGLVSRFDIRGT